MPSHTFQIYSSILDSIVVSVPACVTRESGVQFPVGEIGFASFQKKKIYPICFHQIISYFQTSICLIRVDQ